MIRLIYKVSPISLANYLSHRTQRVCISEKMSDWGSVTSGVPQGSILGPLLLYYTWMICHSPCPTVKPTCTPTTQSCTTRTNVWISCSRGCNKTSTHWTATNRLKINSIKSVCMLIGVHQKLKSNTLSLSLNKEPLRCVSSIYQIPGCYNWQASKLVHSCWFPY